MTIFKEELRFNYELQADTMFIAGRPVIHIVDVWTHIYAGEFLRSQSTLGLRPMLCNLWMYVYLGSSDFMGAEQGSSYVSNEMRTNTEMSGIIIRY